MLQIARASKDNPQSSYTNDLKSQFLKFIFQNSLIHTSAIADQSAFIGQCHQPSDSAILVHNRDEAEIFSRNGGSRKRLHRTPKTLFDSSVAPLFASNSLYSNQVSPVCGMKAAPRQGYIYKMPLFKQHEPSNSMWPMLFYLSLIFLFLAFATALNWPMPELAFRSDNSPVSWLSSAQLWAMAVLAIRLSFDRTLPLSLGVWLAIAMAGMAFDEQFMFHEKWKYGCADWLGLCRFTSVREFPMLLVGLIGIMTALWLHVSVSPGLARLQLWTAIGIGLFALSMDLIQFSTELAPYEEGFEVLAEAFYMSFLLGLRPAKNEHSVNMKSEQK